MNRVLAAVDVPLAIRLIACMAGALLLGAYAFEYIGRMAPCELCLRQRIPHWVALGLGLVAMVPATRGHAGRARLLLVLMTLAMTVSAGLGLHHVGVESGWWDYAGACSTLASTGSAADPFGDIFTVPLVRCDVPAWTLAGISMAGYNALLSAGLMLVGVAGLLDARKEPKVELRP